MAKKKSNNVDYRGSQVEKLIEWANAWVGHTTFPHANKMADMWVAKDSCQAFVASAYYAAGINNAYTSLSYASQARNAWGKNKLSWKNGKIDCSKIPLGACIYSQCGKDTRGHVSLYIGNGYIIEAGVNPIRKVLLNNTLSGRTYYSWGYNGNKQPQGSATQAVKESKRYLGNFTLTGYCPCVKCCGKNDGITASGKKATANHTVAVDKSKIPLGSKLIINGKTYYAEDVGGAIKDTRIDIFFDTHQEALNFDRQQGDVYLVDSDVTYEETTETTFNLDKRSVENIPEFNKAAKAKLVIDKNNKGVNLKIIHYNVIQDVSQLCSDKIQLITKRRATPAKLTFKIARDLVETGTISFVEGDAVALMYNDVPMFWGYIFSKSRTKEQIIDVVAYDQTRYLKNKDTYCYTKTASELIKTICNDYKLQMGKIANTGYTINERIEDNQSLFDIIFNALDFTNIYAGKAFFFYDDFGDITLKAYDDLMLNLALVSDDNTLIDYSYKTDIDTNTYNKILLYTDDKESGTRVIYSSQDSVNIIKWGVLQRTEKMSEGYTEGQIKDIADRMLDIYNKVNHTFTVEDTGVPELRAGNGIWVSIKDAGDVINAGYMVESCTHTFENGRHTMKLELSERSD